MDGSNDIILPCLTGTLKMKENTSKSVSVLLDTGSQLSFIKSSLADQCNFRVLNSNLTIDINGFNSKTRYETKSVLAKIIIGNEVISFEAICIPKIRTNLDFHGVEKIMDIFQAKGYKLANKDYQNCDREVSVILGINTLHLLETKVVTFGRKDDLSAYLESRFGVILMGSKFSMRENLNFLTAVSTFSCEVNEPENENACEIVSRGVEICTSLGSECSIIDLKGQIEESEMLKATETTLEENCDTYLNLAKDVPEKLMSGLNVELCDFMLNNAVRDDQSGRLVMPLPWNPQVKHLIDDNFRLAKQVLDHNVKKLKKDEQKLIQYNEVLSKQENEGIIERVPDLETLLNENPQGLSFLAHNGVFRPDHQSTKCRIVFLSNLHGNKHRLSLNHVPYQALI